MADTEQPLPHTPELALQGTGSELDRALPYSSSLWEVALGSDGHPVQWAENDAPMRRLPHSDVPFTPRSAQARPFIVQIVK